MCDDIVEFAEVGSQIENVGGPQFDVVQPQRVDEGLAGPDLGGGEVDADATGLRVPPGQGDQVAAGGAAQFQDVGPVRRGRVQAKQTAEHRQAFGAGIRKGNTLVMKLIVRVHG
ncbi:MAG: hypothetical protein U9R74_01110 [Pseudomonadota bacterium]|nr:hypothetical protein [Pseudomonadota bacterium]